jgi:hypothetical protein
VVELDLLRPMNFIRIHVVLTKYIPIIINLFLLFIYVFWHESKIRDMYLYIGFGQSLIYNLYLFSASLSFRFCLWHKVLILNMTICLIIEYLNNKGLFLPDIFDTIIKLTLFSIILSSILYYKNGCYSKKDNHTTL